MKLNSLLIAICCLVIVLCGCASDVSPLGELEIQDAVLCYRSIESHSLECTDAEAIKNFVDMLNGCKFEKTDDELDINSWSDHYEISVNDKYFWLIEMQNGDCFMTLYEDNITSSSDPATIVASETYKLTSCDFSIVEALYNSKFEN